MKLFWFEGAEFSGGRCVTSIALKKMQSVLACFMYQYKLFFTVFLLLKSNFLHLGYVTTLFLTDMVGSALSIHAH